jgi:hypothetical protein
MNPNEMRRWAFLLIGATGLLVFVVAILPRFFVG